MPAAFAGGLMLAAVLCSAAYAASRSIPKPPRGTPWEQAERGREELEATPAEQRTRAEFTTAMDRFRAIYHDGPGDVHAAASVFAVAELLAEQGRVLHDAKSLQAAVGQYEFLRKQYPGSSLRIPALLAEGQVEANDLDDKAGAKDHYRELLKRYPRSEQAEEARAGLESLKAGKVRTGVNEAVLTQPAGIANGGDQTPVRAEAAKPGATLRESSTAQKASVAVAEAPATATVPKSKDAPDLKARSRDPIDEDAAIPSPLEGGGLPVSARRPGGASGETRKGPLAQVKGIRHWSTPTYTRVAIDLGEDVKFEAARVPNPDRIYFDLHGSRLAPELVGKSFSVTDDGFLKKIRAAQFSDNMTRVVLDVNDVSEYSAFLLPNPYRLIIDIHGGSKATTRREAPPIETTKAGSAPIAAPVVLPPSVTATSSLPSTPTTSGRPGPSVPNTVATKTNNTTEVAALSTQPDRVEATTRPTSKPISEVVTDRPAVAYDRPPTASGRKRSKAKAADGVAAGDAIPARPAVPTADGSTSLVRALGLKIGRIVIDAGHGGHDSGTLGADGIEEKDVVLDVALRLGKLLHERLGAEIVYTRSDDTFIPLETRTAIANKAQADLFISVHANSSPDASARGVETYYLNFTTSPDALQTAARENAVSNQSIHQLSDLVKKITLRDKIDESREFASDVEASLYSGLAKGNDGLKNRGVKKAPFVVLIGANMPSILAEISFVTNPRDAEQLQRPEYRERVAESLYQGVARYESGLSGIKAPTLRASIGSK
ncbi:N-acetylmuramoyl-L-alanine amidase [Granulicella aggregans]|uniref:N-acetylmuramoyl-L-alanine amidase n=1 Tax=Granulicella aggregans TaxID=474949 RepID=A0A7W7ZBL2_9BACT|nr:N-acetylmuramoyl-L-alanine amidase [Granulicella aggregans]MBB5056901.1 N-acetylmuramoyl-L-alanine amidase [Granulicella aggregans]